MFSSRYEQWKLRLALACAERQLATLIHQTFVVASFAELPNSEQPQNSIKDSVKLCEKLSDEGPSCTSRETPEKS